MALCEDPIVVQRLLANGGRHPHENRAVRIYVYFDLMDRDSAEKFAIFYKVEDDNIFSSQQVRSVRMLFNAGRTTKEGSRWLAELQARPAMKNRPHAKHKP